MIYGGCMSIFGWIFAWLLAQTNNILVGPFLFTHSGFTLNSTTNIILFDIAACLMYAGIFPFVLIWMKSDKRVCDGCMCKRCKLKNMHILDEYEELQQHEIDRFMAQNEHEVMLKLNIAMKRLRMECITSAIGMICIYLYLSMLPAPIQISV